jgi:hypothetical protein
MTRSIDNRQDVLDSRDIIARIAELESDRDDFSGEEDITWAQAKEDDAEELRVLKALEDEASGSPDWVHGEGLIRDSYFVTYAQDLADDIGAVKSDAGWPNSYIDWDAAAEALQQDYMSVDFDGVTYWIRS